MSEAGAEETLFWRLDVCLPRALEQTGAPAALARARSVRAFDDLLVAPRNGFGTAARYYAECSALRVMDRIQVPTLLIHAANDPWIPAEAYRAYNWTANPHLTRLVAPGGGHVGFHQADQPPTWHDACLAQWFAAH